MQFFGDICGSIDAIRPFYTFDETCQRAVSQAIELFLESTSFENAIQLAISLGGDCDTTKFIYFCDYEYNEDKQLGLYYVEKELLVKENEEFSEEKNKKFDFKVLEYLWDDVVRYDRQELFDNKIETLDDLIDKYVDYSKNNDSLKVFNNDVFSKNL